eukprot:363027-Chlamydomonas_euryale.AAC.3
MTFPHCNRAPSDFAAGGNLARDRPTGQSSTYVDGQFTEAMTGANAAVDGVYNSNFYEHACTHTKEEIDPWWWDFATTGILGLGTERRMCWAPHEEAACIAQQGAQDTEKPCPRAPFASVETSSGLTRRTTCQLHHPPTEFGTGRTAPLVIVCATLRSALATLLLPWQAAMSRMSGAPSSMKSFQ